MLVLCQLIFEFDSIEEAKASADEVKRQPANEISVTTKITPIIGDELTQFILNVIVSAATGVGTSLLANWIWERLKSIKASPQVITLIVDDKRIPIQVETISKEKLERYLDGRG